MADIPDRRARILVVDDEPENIELLEVVLEHAGFLVATAANGEEALAATAEQPLDLILLDIMMPDMDGYQVVAKIKGNLATSNIPVMMVSALSDPSSKTRAMSAGADDFLGKPVNRAELVLRVRNLLRKAHERSHDN